MSEESKDNKDVLGYLGQSFQEKVLWQLLVHPEFAEMAIPSLSTTYFDNQQHKFIMSMIKKYFEQNNIPATLRNRSIYEFINATNKSLVDKETAFGVLNRMMNYDVNIANGVILNDGESVQKTVWFFIKQQESKILANDIFDKIKTGSLEDNVHFFEDKFKEIMKLGEKHDFGEDVFHNIEDALKEDYRQPIPTGIKAIDEAMAGGLGKGEMGIALMAYGVGKTTFLTKCANTAYNMGKNVLQIFFEDNESDIKRKHYTLWSKIPLSELKEKRETAIELVKKFYDDRKAGNVGGRLILKKMDQENTTIPMIKNWILNYEKLNGIKFDLILLDYLDCVEPHKPTQGDQNKGELIVVKAFEALIAELDIPGWTAVQGNRSAVRSEFVHGDQMGGNIKRAQKTHFLFSVAKSQEQKQDNLANVQIIKSRMTKDGQVYENAIYNNDTLEIRCIEGIRPSETSSAKKANARKDKQLDVAGTLFSSAEIVQMSEDEIRQRKEAYIRKQQQEQEKNNEVKNDSSDNQSDKIVENISVELKE